MQVKYQNILLTKIDGERKTENFKHFLYEQTKIQHTDKHKKRIKFGNPG